MAGHGCRWDSSQVKTIPARIRRVTVHVTRHEQLIDVKLEHPAAHEETRYVHGRRAGRDRGDARHTARGIPRSAAAGKCASCVDDGGHTTGVDGQDGRVASGRIGVAAETHLKARAGRMAGQASATERGYEPQTVNLRPTHIKSAHVATGSW